MKKLASTILAAAMTSAVFAQASDKKSSPTPLEINLTSPIQLLWGERDVYGLRLNLIYGDSYDVYGIDWGFVGVNYGDVAGIQMNAYNWVDGSVYGLQFAKTLNAVTQHMRGLQVSGLVSYNQGDMIGAQFAPLNFNGAFAGLQVGALNWNFGAVEYSWLIGVVNNCSEFTGLSLGGLNLADTLTGAQLGMFNIVFGPARGAQYGLINLADHLVGVQVGLININANGRLPILPLLNMNF